MPSSRRSATIVVAAASVTLLREDLLVFDFGSDKVGQTGFSAWRVRDQEIGEYKKAARPITGPAAFKLQVSVLKLDARWQQERKAADTTRVDLDAATLDIGSKASPGKNCATSFNCRSRHPEAVGSVH